MLSYLGIFDYQLSATVFEAVTLAFLAVYGLVAVLATAQSPVRIRRR
jgi:hypothetical protein